MATTFPTTAETRASLAAATVPHADARFLADLPAFAEWVVDAIVALQAKVGADASAVATSLDYKASGARARGTLISEAFDLDNGAGTTIDRVLARFPFAVTLVAGRIVYEGATTGTVAAGNILVGTTVGGNELVTVTAYENTKTVGTVTALAFAATAVAANAPICVRHTGVAATQAGFAHVELEYTID